MSNSGRTPEEEAERRRAEFLGEREPEPTKSLGDHAKEAAERARLTAESAIRDKAPMAAQSARDAANQAKQRIDQEREKLHTPKVERPGCFSFRAPKKQGLSCGTAAGGGCGCLVIIIVLLFILLSPK